jgi:putative membrane protein
MFPFPTGRITTVMTVVAALTGPSAVVAQSYSGATAPPTSPPPNPLERTLIITLTKADRDEVLMARAALPTLQDADVKRYAQRMIDDHTAHLTAINVIAARLRLLPAPDTTRGGEPAATTDTGYINAMVAGHQQLLGQLPADASGVQDQGLRQNLAETRRTVQAHLDEAIRIKARLAGRAP